MLEDYLATGKCENGEIGTPDPVRNRPNASFDLGLGLFKLAERFGRRFGEEEPIGDGGKSAQADAEKSPQRILARQLRPTPRWVNAIRASNVRSAS